MLLLKTLLLISAAVTAVVRFISFKYAERIPSETLAILLRVSIGSAAVCVVCAAIWVILIKKEEKKSKTGKTDD